MVNEDNILLFQQVMFKQYIHYCGFFHSFLTSIIFYINKILCTNRKGNDNVIATYFSLLYLFIFNKEMKKKETNDPFSKQFLSQFAEKHFL
jgi:hypothetical protein